MSLAFIGLGSNLGNGRDNIRRAWQLVADADGVTAIGISSPYLTEPVGMESGQWFTNAAGALVTTLSPHELLSLLLGVERELGRDRAQGRDRTVNLDILLYDDLILATGDLVIPHPEMHTRLFVLAPLEELAPDHIHPENGSSVSRLKRCCRAEGQGIKKISWDDSP